MFRKKKRDKVEKTLEEAEKAAEKSAACLLFKLQQQQTMNATLGTQPLVIEMGGPMVVGTSSPATTNNKKKKKRKTKTKMGEIGMNLLQEEESESNAFIAG